MRTVFFKNKPKIIATSSIAGPKESNGSIAGYIETTLDDDMYGENTFEKAETKMLFKVFEKTIQNAKLTPENVDVIIAGDLLNQIISASFCMREYDASFIGLYNACGTFAESLLLGSALVDGGYKDNLICISGSHFSTAERQYRYPLELGVLRAPVSQWTATGVGASVVSSFKNRKICRVTKATAGRVIDFGVRDVNNMGAAMAPAACDTICQFFRDTKTTPDDYDKIFTGDLGRLGKKILKDLLREQEIDLDGKLEDCGDLLFKEEQQTNQGGSGAACSAILFNSFILDKFKKREYEKILLVGTGALLSSITSFQGESIPCIAHCLEIML